MMHRPYGYDRWLWRFLLAAGLVLLALVAISSRQQPVQAKPNYLMAFGATYPNVVGTSLDSCSTCHTSAIPALNPYGLAFAGSGHNFKSIESADSDGDGASNLAEIMALTLPGDANSKPAASPTPTQVSTAPTATPTQVSTAPTATPTRIRPGPTATATQVGAPATPTVTRTPEGDDDHDKTPEATRTPDGDDDDDHDKTPEATRTPIPTETPEGDDTPEPKETPEATHTSTPAALATLTATPTPEPTETPEANTTTEPTQTPEATETPETHHTPGDSVDLHGFIENLGPNDLTVAGQRVQIDIHTEIHQDHGAVAVGAEVDVKAEVRAASTFYARRIDILNSPAVTVRTYLPLFIRRR